MTELMVYLTLLLCLPAVVSKLSLMPRRLSLLYGAVGALFAYLMIGPVSRAPQSQVESYISSPTIRQYLAILVTLELVLLLSYAFRPRRADYGSETLPLRREERPSWARLLRQCLGMIRKYYVTLLIFPALFFLQVQLCYALPGADFHIPAAIVGGTSLILVPLLAEVIRVTLPEEVMRESLAVSTSAMLCIAALLSTATDSLLYLPAETGTALSPEVIMVGVVALVLFVGSLIAQHYRKYTIR